MYQEDVILFPIRYAVPNTVPNTEHIEIIAFSCSTKFFEFHSKISFFSENSMNIMKDSNHHVHPTFRKKMLSEFILNILG